MKPEEKVQQSIERKAMGMIAVAVLFEVLAMVLSWLGGWFVVAASGAAVFAVTLCVRAGMLWSGVASLGDLLNRDWFEG